MSKRSIILKKKVIVIGAGIAGLAGGYALMKNGFSVTIFEKNSRVGGRMRTESVEGRFTIDTGAQDLHDRRAAPNTFRLIDELGMKDKVVPFAFTSAMVRNGIVHKMPRQKLTAAFRFSGLSLACPGQDFKNGSIPGKTSSKAGQGKTGKLGYAGYRNHRTIYAAGI